MKLKQIATTKVRIQSYKMLKIHSKPTTGIRIGDVDHGPGTGSYCGVGAVDLWWSTGLILPKDFLSLKTFAVVTKLYLFINWMSERRERHPLTWV